MTVSADSRNRCSRASNNALRRMGGWILDDGRNPFTNRAARLDTVALIDVVAKGVPRYCIIRLIASRSASLSVPTACFKRKRFNRKS